MSTSKRYARKPCLRKVVTESHKYCANHCCNYPTLDGDRCKNQIAVMHTKRCKEHSTGKGGASGGAGGGAAASSSKKKATIAKSTSSKSPAPKRPRKG